MRAALALGAEVARESRFDRKNYFYCDLPQGYQISQLYHPIVGEGEVLVEMGPGVARLVRIERIHLEQDAGKSIHEGLDQSSGIDLNRAGTPLLEIVSEPDIGSAKEAVAYMRKIHTIVRYLGISDGTVKLHVKSILRKLGVHSRVEAAVIAVEQGLRTNRGGDNSNA